MPKVLILWAAHVVIKVSAWNSPSVRLISKSTDEQVCFLTWTCVFSSNLCELMCASATLCLEGFVSLLSSITNGSYSPISSYRKSSKAQGEQLEGEFPFRNAFFKICHSLRILPSCGFLYLFPSAAERSLSDDGWARHWSVGIAGYH